MRQIPFHFFFVFNFAVVVVVAFLAQPTVTPIRVGLYPFFFLFDFFFFFFSICSLVTGILEINKLILSLVFRSISCVCMCVCVFWALYANGMPITLWVHIKMMDFKYKDESNRFIDRRATGNLFHMPFARNHTRNALLLPKWKIHSTNEMICTQIQIGISFFSSFNWLFDWLADTPFKIWYNSCGPFINQNQWAGFLFSLILILISIEISIG